MNEKLFNVKLSESLPIIIYDTAASNIHQQVPCTRKK